MISCAEIQKIKLMSDFNDYYDHWFDVYDTGITFERMSINGMSRRWMLEYLQSLGVRVPFFGLSHEILSQKKACIDTPIIIHIDEFAHRGEGKVKTTLGEAISEYPDRLAVEYIPSFTSKGSRSCRYLQVGDNIFWLEYIGKSDWRSNYGDVDIRVFSHTNNRYHNKINTPLFAIDFVINSKGVIYAIDFNTSPGIKGTGVENILSAKNAATAIKKAIFRKHRIEKSHETPKNINEIEINFIDSKKREDKING